MAMTKEETPKIYRYEWRRPLELKPNKIEI